MTDRERLLNLIDQYQMDSLEAILNCYFMTYNHTISAKRMYGLIKEMNFYLEDKIGDLESLKFIANERATYIKKYLEGKMWPDEETAKFYLQPQIDNAQAIIDACSCK